MVFKLQTLICLCLPLGEGGPLAVDEANYKKRNYLIRLDLALRSLRHLPQGEGKRHTRPRGRGDGQVSLIRQTAP